MTGAVRAFIGLGSNLEDPRRQIRTAIAELDALPYTCVAARSSLYRSDPMGPPNQPDYINAVAAVDTILTPLALLDALMGVERSHGRIRHAERWGPRTLDLDLLVYGDRITSDARLTLPHPGIAERVFVLLPLLEIAPDLEIPGRGRAAALAAVLPDGGIERLKSDE
ncbi:MAG: 2-amino-4-hydroxy-6-hydroxymethyldihydropteridine pyrophosphokinase [Gammaproteobacteria bacterium]|nr:2-amino-4-hydroxy-6-hydroxymethyldihydropteridine pyrophosphokinase [Gammaproteobacteria bacterium]